MQDLLGNIIRSKRSRTRREHVLLNPVVGPEPLTASSRMKGGSATKVILDVVCAHAVDLLRNNSSSTMAEGMAAGEASHCAIPGGIPSCYSSAESISSVLSALEIPLQTADMCTGSELVL